MSFFFFFRRTGSWCSLRDEQHWQPFCGPFSESFWWVFDRSSQADDVSLSLWAPFVRTYVAESFAARAARCRISSFPSPFFFFGSGADPPPPMELDAPPGVNYR